MTSSHRTRAGITAVLAVAATALTFPGAADGAAPIASARVTSTDDGYRYVAADGQDNNMVVTADEDSIDIHDTAVTDLGDVPFGCAPVTVEEGAAVTCAREGHIVLRVRLADGTDMIDGSELPADVDLWFFGGPGDNTVLAGAGNDILQGGNDPDATDTLYGWRGDDILRTRAGSGWLTGHAGDDLIIGGSGPGTVDFIYPKAGNDVIRTRDGLNIVASSPGDDRITGGGGYDSLDGGRGEDVLRGGGGGDTLTGGPDRDRMVGGSGDDDLIARGDKLRDTALCGTGEDTAYVDNGRKDRAQRCETVTRTNY